ncbi:solute carrier family 2, facilitated glucose transporter member 10-like [Asterias amurensis]|uniref:solute carrier family 2, facilitated glucose transporter member 10-like n=1 Tax=Asterias amurensis TaxID=7602 RepID=UPI003AB8F02C
MMEELEVGGDEMASLTHAEHKADDTTGFVVVAAIMSALGGILFGYDIGIVSGALLQLREEFELSCLQQEMVVSSLLVGALIGALFGGFLVDWIGRRWSIIINTGIFITGAVILTCAPIYEILILGRLIVGFAVSLSAIAECIYISEISPSTKRGQLVCVNEVGITLGILVAYLVNFFLISVPSGWRYMFGLSILPAVIQGVGMFLLPPSPRFLMQKGKESQARTVLQKLRGTELIEGELSVIRNSLLTEQDYRVWDVLSTVNNMRGRFLIGAGLVFFQQFTGQTNVLYYAPTIFKSLGFESNTAATLATVGLGIVKVVTTFMCLCFVDKAGRRHFLLVGAGIMTVIIFTLGIVTQVSLPSTAKRTCFMNTSEENLTTVVMSQMQDTSRLDRSLNQMDLSMLRIPDSAVKEMSRNSSELLIGLISKGYFEETRRDRVKRKANQESTSSSTKVTLSLVDPGGQRSTSSSTKVTLSPLVTGGGLLTGMTVPEQPSQTKKGNLYTTAAVSGVSDRTSPHESGSALMTTLKPEATSTGGMSTEDGPGLAQIVAVISLTLYVGAYSYGFGPVGWLVLSEIFPAGIRGRASSLASIFNWGTNVVVSLTFLDVINGIGPSWTFLLYGAICAVSFIFIYLIVPETKNRSLEQISAKLNKKSHMTGLSGHSCFKRLGSCLQCCHENTHQRLPLSDSFTDVNIGVDEGVCEDTIEN